jgi:hypothetical protein
MFPLSALERSVLGTVVWFSMFETPVTVFEIWKWMIGADQAYAFEDVYAALEGEELRRRLETHDGFWTLAGSQCRALATERRTRFLDAARKYAKLRRAARYFALIPSVESVSAANTLAWWNTREDSDVDLYVTVRPGTIWTTRLFMVAPFVLLGRRPGTSHVDPFCFSFFATTDAPPVASFALPGGDPYLDLWERSLVSVYERPRGRETFAIGGATVPRQAFGFEPRGRMIRAVESLARRVQMRRLPARVKRMMNVDSRVVVNDRVLKFHDNDRREAYRDQWRKLISGVA